MELREVDLNLLVVFDAIIIERNVTRAGRRLGLSQPATSAALGRLRMMFDDPILERDGARGRLTPFAKAAAEPLRAILSNIDAVLKRKQSFEPTTCAVTFRIAASDDVSFVLIPPLLDLLERVAPRVRLLVSRPEFDTGERLASRQLHLSIEPSGRYRNRDFDSITLYDDPWVVAVWQGNKQVGKSLDIEQFKRLRHVTLSLRPYATTLLSRILGAPSEQLDVQVVTESFTGLAMLLRGTQLAALLPGRLALRLKESAEIRLLRPPLQLQDTAHAMAWSPLFAHDQAHVWLRQTIVQVARSLPALDGVVHPR